MEIKMLSGEDIYIRTESNQVKKIVCDQMNELHDYDVQPSQY